MRVGWVHLDDGDQEPPLPSASFLDVAGVGAGMRSPKRLLRLYFKGRPPAEEIATKARGWAGQVECIQIGNECNLAEEGFGGTPAEYLAWFLEVKRLAPGVPLGWGAPSPGVWGWDRWYDGADAADVIVCHAYGSFGEMQAVVTYVLSRFPGKPIWVGECNFGAGRKVDVNAWVRDDFKPFLDWCSRQPQIVAVNYFARTWNESANLPTSVDGAGTAIETLIKSFVPASLPEEPAMPVDSNLRIYADWALARLRNGEEPRDVTAFVTHLKAIGADWQQPARYGLPFVVVSPK